MVWVLGTYSWIRYQTGSLNVDDSLHELDTADLDWVRGCVPSSEDVLFDGHHFLPRAFIFRMIYAVIFMLLDA